MRPKQEATGHTNWATAFFVVDWVICFGKSVRGPHRKTVTKSSVQLGLERVIIRVCVRAKTSHISPILAEFNKQWPAIIATAWRSRIDVFVGEKTDCPVSHICSFTDKAPW